MNIIITIIIVIAAIIALLLIIALFLRKEYNISREIIINKPVADVFDYLTKICHARSLYVLTGILYME